MKTEGNQIANILTRLIVETVKNSINLPSPLITMIAKYYGYSFMDKTPDEKDEDIRKLLSPSDWKKELTFLDEKGMLGEIDVIAEHLKADSQTLSQKYGKDLFRRVHSNLTEMRMVAFLYEKRTYLRDFTQYPQYNYDSSQEDLPLISSNEIEIKQQELSQKLFTKGNFYAAVKYSGPDSLLIMKSGPFCYYMGGEIDSAWGNINTLRYLALYHYNSDEKKSTQLLLIRCRPWLFTVLNNFLHWFAPYNIKFRVDNPVFKLPSELLHIHAHGHALYQLMPPILWLGEQLRKQLFDLTNPKNKNDINFNLAELNNLLRTYVFELNCFLELYSEILKVDTGCVVSSLPPVKTKKEASLVYQQAFFSPTRISNYVSYSREKNNASGNFVNNCILM